MIRKEHTYGMWLKMHKQTERESYSHRERTTEATMAEGINPRTNKTKNKKNWAQNISSNRQLSPPS